MANNQLNIHDSHLGFFETANGLIVNLNNPTVDMIDIHDIATALGNFCRFGGHVSPFYSVAQHSCMVALLAINNLESSEVVRAALMHDATEAYLGDVIKPLKIILGERYKELERKFEKVIFEKFELDLALLPIVKKYDVQALEIEHTYLRKHGKSDDWDMVWRSKYAYTDVWDPAKAGTRFLDFHEHLNITKWII
jgi:hypothetical protein